MLFDKLEKVVCRFDELEALLQTPAVINNSAVFTGYAREHGQLRPLVELYRRWSEARRQETSARQVLAEEQDPELRSLAEEESEKAGTERKGLEQELEEYLLMEDEDAGKNVIMEIRAGTGGEEAALFSADLFRMYARYAESRGWTIEVLNSSPTDLRGYKELIFSMMGVNVFRRLRYEGGGHRVQRVPKTEAQGRIHTSACTVAVLPEVEEVDIEVNPSDLRVDTYRAGGPGGQNVNKTSSAVRITHLPTGLVVCCQDESSQHKNRARAMKILRARLYEMERNKIKEERDTARRNMIGSGDRSMRIRTYNFPQNRVTDHRINQNYQLETVIEGKLDEMLDALARYDRLLRLEQAGKETKKE